MNDEMDRLWKNRWGGESHGKTEQTHAMHHSFKVADKLQWPPVGSLGKDCFPLAHVTTFVKWMNTSYRITWRVTWHFMSVQIRLNRWFRNRYTHCPPHISEAHTAEGQATIMSEIYPAIPPPTPYGSVCLESVGTPILSSVGQLHIKHLLSENRAEIEKLQSK